MKISLLSLLLFLSSFSFSQASYNIKKGNTKALVIGISQYEDERFEDLKFANRDAEIFADYLKTKAGGNVDPNNITVLTNAAATHARIIDEMQKLLNNAQKDDLVIFYFSGHGDVEVSSIHEKGFLLAHNTNFNNYRLNAIRLEDLNLNAHLMSIDKKANVVLILDACHSGQLAGDNNNGRVSISREMEKLAGKEVRILSCQADQKSLEVTDLDGGRGLFSYFLIRGLVGEAESDGDRQVSKTELGAYLQAKVNPEAKRRSGKSQFPEVTGDYDFRLSFVDEEALAVLRNNDALSSNEAVAAVDRGIEKSAARVENSNQDFIYKPFDEAIQHKRLLFPEDQSAFYFYNNLLQESHKDKRLPKLKSQLVVALQDEAQSAINAYLRGDQLELNRRIYMSEALDYNTFPAYLEKAAELVGQDYPAYKGIKAKQFYFEGINARLEAAKSGYSPENLQKALTLQNEAMKLEDKAAYIHNEIGLIHFYLKKYEMAEFGFRSAISLSPTWAIPHSNLCALYLKLQLYKEANIWGQKALDLQPDLLNSNISMGLVNEKRQHYLKAEEYYRTALKLSWDHYSAFERLAFIYTFMGDYTLANHLFKEAEIRKKDVFPQILQSKINVEAGTNNNLIERFLPSEEELLLMIETNPFDAEAWQMLGQLYISEDRIEEAEACFKKVIFIQPDSLAAYHDLGYLYESWGRYIEAMATYKTILPQDSTAAPKIWNILEDLKRFDEAEVTVKQYGNAVSLYKFYGRMLAIFPDLATYWYKRGILLYNEKEAGYHFWGWQARTPNKKHISISWEDKKSETIVKPDFDQWTEFWGSQAIADFEKTLELEPTHPAKVDIHLKLGEMYALWSELYKADIFIESRIRKSRQDSTQLNLYHDFLGMMQKAIENSEKAFDLEKLEIPNPLPDGIMRFGEPSSQLAPTYQLIDQYLANFEHEKSLALLDTLFKKGLLDFENRQKLIRIYLLSNQLEKAKTMLDWALEKPFGKTENIYALQGLYFQLTEDYPKAIESYQKVAEPAAVSISQSELPEHLVFYQYKIASLYALDGNEKSALKMLESAFKNGFNFKKVLANDPNLNNIFNSKNFKKLLIKYDLANETAY